jgi:hypothetical protein
MYERHTNEQHFFDDATLGTLAKLAAGYKNPCCLCTPLLGEELYRRGVTAAILDVDERFSNLPGFRPYNLAGGEWIGEDFGIIVCDPPFFGVSLSQLFRVSRVLSRYSFGQPLLVCYLTRRRTSFLRSFAPFELEPTGFFPGYNTVQNAERNQIEFFGNLGESAHAQLRSAQT